MTPTCLRQALACVLLASAAATRLAAQTTPVPTVPANREDAVVLSPFTVTTDRDAGFVGATSLAGGRLASDLKDTAADYSVQTRDFLDALGITDLQEAAQWTVNSMDTGDDGGETAFGNPLSNRMRFRGLASLRRSSQLLLEEHGYRSITAGNGEAGFAAYLENRDAVRLVLTDLMMPVMSGLTLIRAVRAVAPSLPVIATSGLTDQAKYNELKAMDVNRVLPKPCNVVDLLEAIRDALAEQVRLSIRQSKGAAKAER